VIPHGVEVFVGLDPIDLRWGFDRLCGAVLEKLGRDARTGALFVFFGRRKTAVKVLFLDGSGLCIFYKTTNARFAVREPVQPGLDHIALSDVHARLLAELVATAQALHERRSERAGNGSSIVQRRGMICPRV
jgi:transposase